MLPEVQQYVRNSASGLGGRAQRVRVVAATPYGAVPPDGTVDGFRGASRQSLNAGDERAGVVAFDDQVNVVALNREVGDSKPQEHRSGDRAAYRREDPL
jgi:hypothetical protein